jgi:hypothetical protein
MYNDVNKSSILSCYDGHGTIMLYNPNNTLDTHEIHIQNGIEIIAATFNLTLEEQSMSLFINLPQHVLKFFFNY